MQSFTYEKKVNIRTLSLLYTLFSSYGRTVKSFVNYYEYSSVKLSLTSATGFLERTYCLILRNGQLKYITALTSRMRCISYACSIDNDVLSVCVCANIREQPFTALYFFLIYLIILEKTCTYTTCILGQILIPDIINMKRIIISSYILHT